MVSRPHLELQLGVVDQLQQVGPKGWCDVSGCVAAQLGERAAVQLSNDLQACTVSFRCTCCTALLSPCQGFNSALYLTELAYSRSSALSPLAEAAQAASLPGG